MAVNVEYVRERLRAYIYPRCPETEAQRGAFERAVEAQCDFEAANPMDVIPDGVASISNDGMSVTYTSGGRNAGYTQASIAPAAYAYLMNAGLLPGSIPRARRL